MNDYSFVSRIHNPDKQIIFAVVDPNATAKYEAEGVTFYPTDEQLRLDRLQNKNIIWLQELVDNKCKECWGKGTTGTMYYTPNIHALNELFAANFPDNIPNLINELLKGFKLGEDFREVFQELLNVALEEYNEEKDPLVGSKYVKVIQQDFKQAKVQYCPKCFLPNMTKAIADVRRQIKFGVN